MMFSFYVGYIPSDSPNKRFQNIGVEAPNDHEARRIVLDAYLQRKCQVCSIDFRGKEKTDKDTPPESSDYDPNKYGNLEDDWWKGEDS